MDISEHHPKLTLCTTYRRKFIVTSKVAPPHISRENTSDVLNAVFVASAAFIKSAVLILVARRLWWASLLKVIFYDYVGSNERKCKEMRKTMKVFLTGPLSEESNYYESENSYHVVSVTKTFWCSLTAFARALGPCSLRIFLQCVGIPSLPFFLPSKIA